MQDYNYQDHLQTPYNLDDLYRIRVIYCVVKQWKDDSMSLKKLNFQLHTGHITIVTRPQVGHEVS